MKKGSQENDSGRILINELQCVNRSTRNDSKSEYLKKKNPSYSDSAVHGTGIVKKISSV